MVRLSNGSPEFTQDELVIGLAAITIPIILDNRGGVRKLFIGHITDVGNLARVVRMADITIRLSARDSST